MKVYYRITDIPSTNPSPWGKDKHELNTVCLRSFVDAFKDIEPEMHFIADHCSSETLAMIEQIVPFSHMVYETKLGINDTMRFSYELAGQENDFVLFQECDYLYRPSIGKGYVKALEKLSIVSPYDHRNFYIDESIHSPRCAITLIGEQHYRTTERNTMTWATHSSIVRDNIDILDKYGYLDSDVWDELLIAGHVLWVPILSFATHCVADYLAPGINWGSVWKKYQSA